MKPTAFLFGLLASALAFAATPELGGLRQAFLEAWAPTGRAPELGLLLWYLAAGAGAAGGALALLSPLSGGLLLVAAACGWLALGTALPDGQGLYVSAPLALCLLGSLASFVGAGSPRALPVTARRTPSLAELEREAALNLDLSFGTDRPPLHEEVRPPLPPITAEGRRRGSVLAVVNFVLLIGLAGAVGLLYYLQWQDASPPAPSALAAAAPAPPPAAVESARAAAGGLPDALQVQPQPAAAPLAAENAVAEWSDPFAYCAAVGTIDAPDRRYTGPRLPIAIAEGLGVPAVSPVDRARWRCANGAVLACASFVRPICAATPTAEEMTAFCSRYPGATGLLAPAGTWSCVGTEPQIGAGETWSVDLQGFYPAAWVKIAAR